MIRKSFRHVVTALVLLVAFFAVQGTWALAGTTGGFAGSVVDSDTGAPIAAADVTIASPSQTASRTTDAAGRFTFLVLPPDTYTVTIAKSGYQSVSIAGQVVFADTVQTVSVRMLKSLKTIAHVSATGAGTLVKSGTTADIYSVNAAAQKAASALGGGGGLNSAYSAVASVPGAYVPANQMGYFQTVSIRGGDYDQVGYEFDGVPVNRSFDNYPSSSASSLGNAEVQVYTGANPANSEGQGLSGYINQVIKTGTYPGYVNAELGIGTPTFYHRAMVEAGGATPDRLFSYYVGVAGYNQDFNYVDNQNGATYDNWVGAPMSLAPNISYAPTQNVIGGLGPFQYFMGPFNYAALSNISARDAVVNFHVGIPHKYDAGKDDVQLLWDSESLHNNFYSTTNDITSTANCPGGTSPQDCANNIGLGIPLYVDNVTWGCAGAVGKAFSAAGLNGQAGCVKPYYYPNSTNRTLTFQQCLSTGNIAPCEIPPTASDTIWNNQEIVKLQYTKNFGSTAFLRLYGYTYYSDWLQNGPQTTYADFAGCCSPDYELNSHTRGLSLSYQNQINAQNLLSAQASYVTANSIRDNNSFYAVSGQTAAAVVSAANPYGGLCYAAPTATTTNKATPVQCNGSGVTFGTIQAGQVPDVSGFTCGGAPCEYIVTENGLHATYNQVIPRFFSASLLDEWRPSDKWLLNAGVRLDSFTFIGSNTDTGEPRAFWTNAFNLDYCVNNISGQPTSKASLGLNPTQACPTDFHNANWQNLPAQFTYNIYQPRVSGTYTVNSGNVLRFSYGRYTQAPNSAFEQYNTLQDNLAAYDAANFYAFGRTSPGYPIAPPTSINYDVSWEHHFNGTDLSFKLTPFLRQTQNQIQNFFLDQKTGFISGLNAGDQRSQGVEFQFQKGDFSRNGFSGQLSFAYTNSYIHYGTLPSGLYGTTVIGGTNQQISAYNAYTQACAPGGAYVGKIGANHVPYCGTATNSAGNPVAAAPCYTTAGAPVYTCTAADIGNPYWKNPQPLIDPGTAFPTFDIFPGGIGSAGAAYGVPYAASLILNYKHDKWAITPSMSFAGGGKYGVPQSNPGINPAGCAAVLPGVAGYNGGGRYDALSCGSIGAVPNTYTGVFDPLGSFTQPNFFGLNMALTYDVSPKLSLVGVLANIVNTCWGGTKAAWTSNNGNVCGYSTGGFGSSIFPVGNDYNPAGFHGSIVQPVVKYPYSPLFGPFNQDGSSTKTPFQFYVTANIKI